MSDSLKKQQFKSWLRRPTLFIANAWYLMAAAGQTVVPYALILIIRLISLIIPIELSDASLVYTSSTMQQLLVLALPVIVYAVRHEGVSQSMRLNPPQFDMTLYSFTAALFSVMLCGCLSTWWSLLFEQLGGWLYSSSIPVPTTYEELIVSILLVGVTPGICEELLFRGALMGAWERRGTVKAVVVTSVLFALLHGSVLGLPVQLLMGFALGYVVVVSDSLYAGMTFHTVYNSFTIFLNYLSARQPSVSDALSRMTVSEYIAVTGGYASLLLETLLTGALLAGVLLMMFRAQKQREVEIVKISGGDPAKLTWQELLLLLCGLITVGVAYLEDLLWIFGIIL